MMTSHAYSLHRATRRFRGTTALDDASLAIEPETICGLLGRNGAGKTTLMSLLAGQDRPTSGSVEVFGHDPFEHGPTLGQISFVRDNQKYPDAFKLKHVLKSAPHFHANWSAELAAELASAFRLPDKTVIQKYSRGQMSAIGILIGLASRAPLTIFDEPYLGLDSTARQIFYRKLIEDYAAHPRTIVLSTHLIDEMDSLIEHVVILDQGRVVLDAPAEEARGSAFVATGKTDAVTQFASTLHVLDRHAIGTLTAMTIASHLTPELRRDADALGVDVSGASLQQIVASYGAASSHSDGLAPGAASPSTSSDSPASAPTTGALT